MRSAKWYLSMWIMFEVCISLLVLLLMIIQMPVVVETGFIFTTHYAECGVKISVPYPAP